MYRKLKELNWKPPVSWTRISTIDMHTGGEPLRILADGYPEIKGGSILEKRLYFRDHLDHMQIKRSVMIKQKISHPFEQDLSFLYGTIFTGRAKNPSNHSRNVCVFANGELDRSARGSGVSARAALHHARGELKLGELIEIESILGTTMKVELAALTTFGPHKAVIPKVSGTASFTGKNSYWFDPEDPLKEGFFIR